MTSNIRRRQSRAISSILATALIFGLQACATQLRSDVTDTHTLSTLNSTRMAEATQLDSQYQHNADLVYMLMVAEVAAQKGQLAQSVKYYLKAARLSKDPKIAERATRVASFARDYVSAMKAAERWAELQPDNLDVQHSLVILYLRNEMLDKAVDAVDLVLKLTAKSKIQGFGHLVALLNNESDKEAVLKLMDRVVSNYHNNPHAHFAYARLAFQSKHYELSRKHVDEAIRLKPDYDAAWSLQARTMMMQGNTDEALATMRKLVDKKPKSATHRASYARLLAVAKRYDEALKQFKLVLQATPDNGDIVYAIALLNLEQRKFQSARKYFKRLIKHRKHVFESYYYLGSIAEELKQYKKAIDWYNKVQHGQNKMDAAIRVAQLLAKQGRLDDARNHLHKMHNRDPNLSIRLYVVEIDVLSQAKEYKAGMMVVNRALGEYPDDADLLYARSLLAEKLNQLDQAESDLKKILEKDPKNVHALNALGYTLADRTERLQEAYGYIKQALTLAPDEPAILDSMGWVLYRMGRSREATEYLRRALAILQDDEIAAHLGEVLWVTGQKKEANEVWQKALKAKPDSIHLRNVLERFNP